MIKTVRIFPSATVMWKRPLKTTHVRSMFNSVPHRGPIYGNKSRPVRPTKVTDLKVPVQTSTGPEGDRVSGKGVLR